MMTRKKKAAGPKPKGPVSKKATNRATREERRAQKLERRKKEKRLYTADMWAEPAPSHLIGKLDMPKVSSKYQSYLVFADNPEKKEKKLEIQVTKNPTPSPGYVFVPIGDPLLTSTCKELSREKDAMVFIVSSAGTEENAKISEHVHRTGYHFREAIVDEAREIIGETAVLKPTNPPGTIEPIPELQEEINKQADAAIRDLFPRIPHTDRVMIIEHAFKKGGLFHGEPTVGLQVNIPLARRVQLAVLAHIRHTHTRYDKLLRETSWMNARKAVESVCLDVLINWRGDEETGRDQLDELLREVIIITDSENEDDSTSDDDTSSEEGEVTAASSPETPQPTSRAQRRSIEAGNAAKTQNMDVMDLADEIPATTTISSRTRSKSQKDKKAQRGFKRYRAAWEDARNRRHQGLTESSTAGYTRRTEIDEPYHRPASNLQSTIRGSQFNPSSEIPRSMRQQPDHRLYQEQVRYDQPAIATRPGQISTYSSQQQPGPFTRRDEVIVRPYAERSVLYGDLPQRVGTPIRPVWDQVPSQVVRGSPVRHGLQDMLVPSIETGSSDIASPRLDERESVQSNFQHPQDSYPRRAMGNRRLSPPVRQVIVIEDDSPIQRRRLFRGDEVGTSRPLPPRDYGAPISIPRSNSHFLPTSSAQHSDFFVQQPRVHSQSAQGLYRSTQAMYTDPATSEQLPIYDVPENGNFPSHPRNHRRPESVHMAQAGERGSRHLNSPQFSPAKLSDSQYQQGPSRLPGWSDNMEIVEHNHGIMREPEFSRSRDLPPRASHFPPERNMLAAHEVGYGSATRDAGPVQNFSHSAFAQYPSQTRSGLDRGSGGVPGFPERVAHYEPHTASSFESIPIVRARSPVQYLERSGYHQPEYQERVYYDQRPGVGYGVPHQQAAPPMNQQAFPPNRGQAWTQPVNPGRQVFVID